MLQVCVCARARAGVSANHALLYTSLTLFLATPCVVVNLFHWI